MSRIARLIVLVGAAAALGVFTPTSAGAGKKNCKVKCAEIEATCNENCKTGPKARPGAKKPRWSAAAKARCHSFCNTMGPDCEVRCKARKKR